MLNRYRSLSLRRQICCALGILSLLSLSATAEAALPPPPGQVLQPLRPAPSLPTAPGAVLALPSPAQQSSHSQETLRVTRIAVVGNTVLTPAQIQTATAGLAGHTVTLGQLDAAATALTQALHTQGYPLAYAFLPAQKISDGIVQIQVVEPRYDQVTIHPSRLSENEAAYTLGVHPGEPITSTTLNRGLLLLDQTPGIRVAGTLIPGTRPATSSLAVTPENRALLSGSAGVNDYGGNYTGRVQWQGQVDLRNPFGYGSQISATGLTTSGGLLHSAGLSLLSPNLWSGLRGSLFASWTHYRLGQQFAPLDVTGRAIQWGAGFSYPVILQPGTVLGAQLNFVQDRFRQQSAANPIPNDTELNLVSLGVNGALAGGQGVTSFAVTVTGGNKVIFGAAQQALDAQGPQTAGGFWIGQFQGARQQDLPAGFRLTGRFQAQVASRNLDASQQLYLGGPYGVMSYSVGSGGGDQGILGRLSLSHRLPLPVPGHLRLAALLQGGEVWQYHNLYPGALAPGYDNRFGMAGAGLGLRYQSRWAEARFDWVHRLGNTANSQGANQHNQFWATLTVYPGAFF